MVRWKKQIMGTLGEITWLECEIKKNLAGLGYGY